MIWYLTKTKHELSIQPWVRRWLRAGPVGKILKTLVAMALLGAIGGVLWVMAMVATPNTGWMEPRRVNFFSVLFSVLAGLVALLTQVPLLFLIVDSIMDRKRTRGDIRRLMRSPDVVLATRGEYIGGHPMLPHGRFVYLTLGGTLENPLLNIILPKTKGMADEVFSMPVLDVEKSREGVGEAAEETTATVVLANITFEAQLMGRRSLLDVEYIGNTGRRYQVELGHFFLGDGEVQNWRNFMVCIQAEAETGQSPHEPWETLPSGQPTEGKG